MIWEPFSRNGPKMYKKPLGFPVKVHDILRLCKTQKTLVKQRFGASKKFIKIPYKTSRLLLLLEPFLRFGSEKYQKLLGYQ